MTTRNSIATSMAVAFAALLAGPAQAYVCGDLTGNKLVSAPDALAALRLSVGQQVQVDCGSQHQILTTGQTQCSNAEGDLTNCAGTGQDGELRKGAPRAFTDNGDGTVTDRATGLQWEQFDDSMGAHGEKNTLSWDGAFLKIAELNLAQFAGHSDWRLPNIFELMTLGHLGQIDPGTFTPYFKHDCTPGCEIPDCACIPTPNYEWSSTTYAPQATLAWALQMRFGDPITQGKFLQSYTARAVRGGFSESDVSENPAFETSCADVNASDSITAPDALAILRKSVGQQVDLTCILRSAPLVTGQVDCFSSVGLAIPCAGTGQDGELQLGIERAFTNNGDGTVTDETTGLVWEILSADGSLHDNAEAFTWEKSFAGKIADLNQAAFAGHSDWRLPNFFELESLVNFGDGKSGVYDSFFNNDCEAGCTNTQCSCLPAGDTLWSSSSPGFHEEYAFTTDLVTGQAMWELKTDSFGARGVREQ